MASHGEAVPHSLVRWCGSVESGAVAGVVCNTWEGLIANRQLCIFITEVLA